MSATAIIVQFKKRRARERVAAWVVLCEVIPDLVRESWGKFSEPFERVVD